MLVKKDDPQFSYRTANSIFEIYRGENQKRLCLAKIPASNSARTHDRFKLHAEVQAIELLVRNNIWDFFHVETEGNTILKIVMPYFGRVDLGEYLQVKPDLDLIEQLNLLRSIAIAIHDIHMLNIVHCNLCPAHLILVDNGPESAKNRHNVEIKVIGFSTSRITAKFGDPLPFPESSPEDRCYQAPELSGKVAWPLDHRADLYSMGILFYQVLSGELPYRGDALEVVHGHVSKPLPSLPARIPSAIVNIVEKLLKKSPADRYSTALAVCQEIDEYIQLHISGHESRNIQIRSKDVPSGIYFHDKLYGRKSQLMEIENLLSKTQPEEKLKPILLAGDGGIGKTSLLRELRRAIKKHSLNYTLINLNEADRSQPYALFEQLATNLIKLSRYQLSTSHATLDSFLQQHLGYDFSLIASSFSILGLNTATGPLQFRDEEYAFLEQKIKSAAIRFLDTMQSNFQCALLIDDLDHADRDSLDIIRGWLSIRRSQNHFVATANLEKMKLNSSDFPENLASWGAEIISIDPLEKKEIIEMLKELYVCAEESQIVAIAQILLQITGGLPAHLKTYLVAAFDKGCCTFNPRELRWHFNPDCFHALGATDDRVDHLKERWAELPSDQAHVLGAGAVLGPTFRSTILAHLVQREHNDIQRLMNVLIAKGFISSLANRDENDWYRFVHEDLQLYCYEKLNPPEVDDIHRKILDQLIEDRNYPQHLTQIVDRLLKIKHKNASELDALPRYLLTLSKTLKMKGAFRKALYYLTTSQSISWDEPVFRETIDMEIMELLYLIGKMEEALAHFTKLSDSKNEYFRYRAHYVKVFALTALKRFNESIELGLKFLATRGIKIRRRRPLPLVLYEISKCRSYLIRHASSIAEIDFSSLDNSVASQNVVMMFAILSASYFSDADLLTVISCFGTRYALEHGVKENSVLLLGPAALSIVSYYHDTQLAVRISKALNRYCEIGSSDYCKATVRYFLNSALECGSIAIQNAEMVAKRHFDEAINSGNVEFALYLDSVIAINCWVYMTLKDGLFKVDESIERAHRYGNASMAYYLTVVRRFLLAMSDDHAEYPRQDRNQNSEFITQRIASTVEGHEASYRIIANAILGNFSEAISHEKRFRKYCSLISGQFLVPLVNFFLAICKLNLRKKAHHFTSYKKNLAVLNNYTGSPNFENKLVLVMAQISALANKKNALELFEKAILLSQNGGFLMEEALANELAGKHLMAIGAPRLAREYLGRAIELYESWGARSKIKAMQLEFPGIKSSRLGTTYEQSEESHSSMRSLDLQSIFKASRAVAESFSSATLAERLLELAMENSVAEAGLVIRKEGSGLSLAFSKGLPNSLGSSTLPIETILLSIGIDHEKIKAVWTSAGIWIQTEKITKSEASISTVWLAESVFALPVARKKQVEMLLLLLHRQKNVFSESNKTVLSIFANQAVISLENTDLISHLETKAIAEAKINAQFAAAQAIQELLLAKSVNIPELDFAYHYQSAEETGGDWFGIYHDPEANICFTFCGDVTGHGIPAALVTGIATGVIGSVVKGYFDLSKSCKTFSPGDVIQNAFQHLHEVLRSTSSSEGRAMTMVAIAIDLNSGRVWHGSAAHVHPIHISPGKVKRPSARGNILGGNAQNGTWNLNTFDMQVGDSILLFTDGLIENVAADGSVLPSRILRKELEKVCDSPSKDILEFIMSSARGHWKDHPADDDCTIVVCRWLGPAPSFK